MMITKIEPVKGKRVKIDIDGSFAFALYVGEAKKFHLEEEEELSQETLVEIYQILLKRGRERALYLIEHQERTRKTLSDKLRQSFYPQEIIDQVLAFLEEYHYLDDERYANRFVSEKQKRKSKKEISYALAGKGVDRELIQQALEQMPDEIEQLQTLLDIRMRRYRNPTRDDINKVYQYFYRRGFSSSSIQHCLDIYRGQLEDMEEQ